MVHYLVNKDKLKNSYFFIFQPLSENEVSNIMGQVVDGIRYLHSYNILHRDLSLSNLLLTKDMKVVSLFCCYFYVFQSSKYLTSTILSDLIGRLCSRYLNLNVWKNAFFLHL